MSNLVILIPFAANPKSDLDDTAGKLRDFFNKISNHLLGENINATIDNIKVVYLTDHETDHEIECQNKDYVILFAHGSNEDTNLYNNKGAKTSMAQTIQKLEEIHAQHTKRVLFMACFSGYEGHIGTTWKTKYPQQEVFASQVSISNLYSSTRRTITGVCRALERLP